MSGFGSTANSTQAFISLSCYLNPQGSSSQQNILAYRSADTLTAGPPGILTVTVAASATTSFNLATLLAAFTAPVFVGVSEVAPTNAGLGFQITTVSGSGKVGVAPNGFWSYVADGTTALPTIFVTNPSSTTVLVLSIGVLST